MKKTFTLLSLILSAGIVFSACSVSSASMPDTFWGLMSWHYTPRTDGAYGVEGSATVKILFTRTEGDNYAISGTVEPDGTSCTQYNYLPEPCDPIWCKVSSVDSGTLRGTAKIEGGVLSATPMWDSELVVHVENMCNPIPDAIVLGPSYNEASIMESLYPTTENPFFYPWTIDVSDITFIDELPVNEVTDIKTGYKNFNGTGIYSSGEGLLGLYRNEPQ